MKKKWCIDIFMSLFLILAMLYMHLGEYIHEWVGVLLFLLFFIHHVLNKYWFKTVLSKKQSMKLRIRSFINCLLCLLLILTLISGVGMSYYLFPFMNIPTLTSLFREIHLACGYWIFVLSAIHLGLHLDIFVRRVKNKVNDKRVKGTLIVLTGCICLYGMYLFIKNRICLYMFLIHKFVYFDYRQTLLSIFSEYTLIFISIAIVTYFVVRKIEIKKEKSQ